MSAALSPLARASLAALLAADRADGGSATAYGWLLGHWTNTDANASASDADAASAAVAVVVRACRFSSAPAERLWLSALLPPATRPLGFYVCAGSGAGGKVGAPLTDAAAAAALKQVPARAIWGDQAAARSACDAEAAVQTAPLLCVIAGDGGADTTFDFFRITGDALSSVVRMRASEAAAAVSSDSAPAADTVAVRCRVSVGPLQVPTAATPAGASLCDAASASSPSLIHVLHAAIRLARVARPHMLMHTLCISPSLPCADY